MASSCTFSAWISASSFRFASSRLWLLRRVVRDCCTAVRACMAASRTADSSVARMAPLALSSWLRVPSSRLAVSSSVLPIASRSVAVRASSFS